MSRQKRHCCQTGAAASARATWGNIPGLDLVRAMEQVLEQVLAGNGAQTG